MKLRTDAISVLIFKLVVKLFSIYEELDGLSNKNLVSKANRKKETKSNQDEKVQFPRFDCYL